MTLEKAKSIEAELQTLGAGEQTADEAKSETFCKKIGIVFSNITVEPVMVLYILPSVMASIATQNLNLEKACRVNLKYNDVICDGLAERNTSMYNTSDEVAVQKLVASMYAWRTVVQSLIPAVLLMFLGSWSDRHRRRKPCILLPMFGEILTCVGFLICTYFFYELPMEFNGIAEALPPAITGGWFAMFMGVFSYVSGISSVETRTIRIGAVHMFSNVSLTVGIALSGILYKQIGFYGVFSVALAMYITGIIYGLFRITEENTQCQLKGEPEKIGFLKDFFDLKHIADTFAVAFKEGERNRKKRICVILILVMVIIGPLHGELGVMYLFVRYRFQWNEIDYSIYSTYTFVLQIVGTLFSLAFFSKFLKIDDALLGVISSSSKVLSCFVYAFAPTSTIFYLGELGVMYLFVRYRFQWNEIDYSIYSTYTFVLQIVGTLFSLAFFSKFLKIDDALLGVISSSSKVLSCFVYAFAPTSTIFYLGAVLEMLNGTSFIAMRSIMSKLVPPDELGKINSLFGVSEALMPLLYGPMYSVVYKATINVLPGTFFLLGGVLTCPAILIFLWLYKENKRDAREEKQNAPQKKQLIENVNLKTTQIA